MGTTSNNTVYVDPEDNTIGEQIAHTDCEGQIIRIGNIISDNCWNSYLVVGVHEDSVECMTDMFDICSISKNRIGEYSIIGKFDVDRFLDFIKEAQHDG